MPGLGKSKTLFVINKLERLQVPRAGFAARRSAAKVHPLCTSFPDQNKNPNKINSLEAFLVNAIFIQALATQKPHRVTNANHLYFGIFSRFTQIDG
ncbi:MAG: hypothetical protein WCI85_05390 [Comamonadaceae bacterium]